MAFDNAAMHLEHLQSFHLQSINNSIGRKKRKYDRYSTTSLQDLDLARTPIDERRPNASRRPWAQPNLDATMEETGGCSTRSARQLNEAETLPNSEKPPLEQSKKEKACNRWARRQDMKADPREVDSNAWGSARPSEATRDSNVRDDVFGRLLNKRTYGVCGDDRPVDWSGEWAPPPEVWEQRTKFNNNNDDYKAAFRSWIEDRMRPLRLSNGVEHRQIPREKLLQYDYIADGIDMIPNTTTINRTNAVKYGFLVTDDPQDGPGKYTSRLQPHELKGLVTLDPNDQESLKYNSETTDILVKNWLRHKNLAESASRQRLEASMGATTPTSVIFQHLEPSLVPAQVPIATFNRPPDLTGGAKAPSVKPPDLRDRIRPQLNIYMRPAREADVPELMRIYNWYVENSPRPCETGSISEDDMGQRLDRSRESKLPFIVAVERQQRGTLQSAEESSRRSKKVRRERLVGFVSVCDFTCQDYVEHISGELELYVDSKHGHLGVGRSLLDKVMEVCDNTYQRKQDTLFCQPPELHHLYGPGGGRQLHKLVVLLRKWRQPRAAALDVRDCDQSRNGGPSFVKSGENEYESWLRRWLEDCGFELEGLLKGVGAKHGR